MPSPTNTGLDLGDGWTTTSLMISAAHRAAVKAVDRTFTYADVVSAVRVTLTECGLAYPGHTADPEKYADDAQRIVDGRFGDLHRSGVFEEVA